MLQLGLPLGTRLGLQGWTGRRHGWVGLRKADGSGDGGGGDEPESGKHLQGCVMGEGNGAEEV